MRKSSTTLLVVIMALSMLAGCARPPAATPTSTAAPTQAEPAAATVPALKLSGQVDREMAWTMDELQAMEVVTVKAAPAGKDAAEYSGVRLNALLDLAGVRAGADTIVMQADDGYGAQAVLTDIRTCQDCLVGFQETLLGLRMVLPDMPGSVWVKGVIDIQVTAANAPAAAFTGGTEKPSGGPVSLVDAVGRTVELAAPPQRIAIIGRGPYMSLHLLYMFPEGPGRLVGIEKRGSTVDDFIPLIDPVFNAVPYTEANPGPEVVAGMKPDLVIMKGQVVDDMADALATLNIPVMYVALETPELFFADVTNMGAILGNEARAQEIIGFYQKKLEMIKKGTEGLRERDKPRVLTIYYTDRGGRVAVEVPAVPWMQTIQVQTAGGNPVWLKAAAETDGWTVTNIEQIAAWNPETVFAIIDYHLGLQNIIDGLKADRQWSRLKSVKNDALYAFPADLYGWDTPEPRWILGMLWLATRMHPERFKDVDMTQEVYDYFGTLYGMDQASVDTMILPKVQMDVH